jgi:hypothetical protein
MPATNLYNSISLAWAANAPLNAILPAANISQGRQEDPDAELPGATKVDVPYATITTVGETKAGQSSKGRWFEEQIQITVYLADLALARQCQKLYRDVLDELIPTLDDGTCVSWERSDGGRVVDDGGIGRAFDTYVLLKQRSRT